MVTIARISLILFPLLGSRVLAGECGAHSSGLSCGLSANNQDSCEGFGCCWNEDAYFNKCTVPTASGYNLVLERNEIGIITGNMSLVSESDLFDGDDFEDLFLQIIQETNGRTRITMDPINEERRWTVPDSLIPRPGGFYDGQAPFPGGFYTQASITSLSPLSFEITRINGGVMPRFNDVIFNFTKNMVYQDQYLQFILTSHPDVMATYGFGESTRAVQQLQYNTTYTLWASDIGAFTFDVTLYGSHPFVIQVLSNGKAHGFMFMNSNAMELTLTKDAEGRQNIGIQSSGGAMEIYVFGGPSPEEVIRQYLQVIGRPALVPHWSLGFHNCRWGYESVAYVEEVVANYSAANIPLQTQWMDIDYMNAYLDFTLDPVSFSESDMTNFVNGLHERGQNFVPIVDPGIYVKNPAYGTFTRGMEQNVFVKDLEGENAYLGQVWPGPTYFPDWYAANTTSWWGNEFSLFHDLVDFDGIWIDMNEVANFCNVDGSAQQCSLSPTNPCLNNTCCLDCTTSDADNSYDFPPFLPNVFYGVLGGKTLPTSALHAGGILEYNTHNLYGFMESIATRKALIDISGKRPFLLSRSTFAGSGAHTAHWTGDNAATWADLAASIVTMNNMALFGIPMIGADICGFAGDTTEELCNRWIQVGAFSPFSRDHNIIDAIPQELYRWDSVAASSRLVLNLRYQLLPHLYTLMFNAHYFGNTVHNAMWMHFPHDPFAHTRDHQYMWGGSILFTPVVEESATSVVGYFPRGKWYSLMDSTLIDCTDGGKFVTLQTPTDTTNVHVRGGHIIPMQSFSMTTEGVRTSPFSLLIALEQFQAAGGTLFFDDGVQNIISSASYMTYAVEGDSKLRSLTLNNSYTLPSAWLRTVEILGLENSGDDCSASITSLGGVRSNVKPVSTVLTSENNYKKLVITFSQDSSVNIASTYELEWSCKAESDEDDDKISAFGTQMEPYEVGLISTAIAVGVIGIIGGAYFAVMQFSGVAKQDPLLPVDKL